MSPKLSQAIKCGRQMKMLIASILCLVVASSCFNFALGQRLFNHDSIVFMRMLGEKQFSILKNTERRPALRYRNFINGVKTDSSNIGIAFNLYNYPDNDFYFSTRDHDFNYTYYRITADGKIDQFLTNTKTEFVGVLENNLIGLEQNSYEPVVREEAFGGVSGGMKGSSELVRTVVALDLETKSKRELFNINHLAIDNTEDIIHLFFLPSGRKILFTTGTYESGDQPIEHIFIYDFDTGKISEMLAPQSSDKWKWHRNFYHLDCYDVTYQYMFMDELVVNSDFEVKALALPKRISFQKVFMDRTKEFFWVPSQTDGVRYANSVLVPYRLTLEMESNLYKIYHNILLEKSDLKDFKMRELNVLKNMVFAKHNYKFDSKYYQALFNIFSFYDNNLSKERTKDVNHLLTEVDKGNLQLINARLNKFK